MSELGINRVNKRSEYADVSDSLFQGDRKQFGGGFASKDDLNAMSVDQQQQAAQKPYKESEELTKAKERVQNWQSSQASTSPSPFGRR